VRRRSIGAVVLAAALAAGAAVQAQLLVLPSVMPGRRGTGSFLWFDRAFPDVDIELVGEHSYVNHPLEVGVLLYFHNQRLGRCYVAPDGLRVAVNGHVLEVFEPGHENGRDRAWTGVGASSLFPCTAANFKSRKGETIEADRPATVTIDLGTRHAEMTAATYFQHRRLVLRSGSTARAGDVVIVDRQPRNQELIDASPSIRLERSTWDSTELFTRQGVTYAAGTWRFALPHLAPGRYKVHAYLNGSDLAVVDACRGVHRCLAQIPNAAYLAVPELDVVE
jgi:hypothetical protein